MEKTGSGSAPPACAQEALDLLNCVTGAGFDQEKCIRFLNALRDCVLDKVKRFRFVSLLFDPQIALFCSCFSQKFMK
ncbi:hypothetical protein MKW92_004457 [Papaver armeniacum]|nr:hypothetical protein MKW92_004457 [Papaver armeniacum]